MFVTPKNTAISLDPNELATSQGWSISEGVAYHSGCFAGVIILRSMEVEEDTTYVVNYKVSSYSSGNVYPIVGGVNGTSEASLGEKSTTIVVPDGATDLTIKFYSDGELGIEYMNIYPVLEETDNGVTLEFNATDNRWVTYYSYKPEMMLKFVNDLFSWKNGKLWKHNVNETRNNFYGVQYGSELVIVLNVNPMEIKNLYSMRVNSNLAWSVDDIYIRPIVGKQAGQRSLIKSGNFVNINGQWFADFLRNMLDPRFGTELEALFNGGSLQGTTAQITLSIDYTEEVRLVSIDILGANQPYSYSQ